MKSTCHLLTLAAVLSASFSALGDELLDRIPKVFERAESQYTGMLKTLGENPQFPRTIKPDGSLVTVKVDDWTTGFFPGSLWFLYEYSGSEDWNKKAVDYTNRLESIRHFSGHHDTGFMLGSSYGNALRLSPDDSTRAVLHDGADALAKRYYPKIGMIRSWDDKAYTCPVIIDNMMNLELLSWAAKNGGDPKLREIAVSHADHTLKNHFRPDGTAYHIVDYNPETAAIRAIHAGQGGDVRTAWARGQGWAIYGFTMMHRETKKPEYLEKAVTVAEAVMAHPNLPSDKVPYWDFGAKPGDSTPRDASSAAVMASALVELSQAVGGEKGAKFLEFARAQMLSLSTPAYLAEPGTNGGFLLAHSTGHLPGKSEINVPLNYADYYYLEALLRYRAVVTKKDRPSFGEVR
ncbi:MAG: glycoside hydrolase family 88 protein [Luteolibacter sp.]